MPQALAFIAPAVFGAGGTLALFTAAGTLTIGGIAVSIAGSLLLSAAFAPDTPKAPKPEDIQLNIRQPIGPRMKHYGRVRVGGTAVFFRTRAGKFYRVIVHGHGEIDGTEKYFLNKGEVTLDGSGFVTETQYTSNGTKRVQIKTRLGVIPETHYSEVTAIWSDWDNTHRLDGLWTSLTIAEQVPPDDFRRVYPNNEPAIEIVARTSKVYDPRTLATAYSDNAALVIADMIESPDGFNRPGTVDYAALAIEADLADGQVALVAGGAEARWRLAGTYALNERPGDVVRRMLNACAGDIRLLPNGKIGVEVGAYRAPTVTLTSADLLEFEEYSHGPDLIERYNTLPFSYVDPSLAYAQTEGEAWNDAARETDDGEELTGPLTDLNYSPSHRQARTAAKIKLARDNPRKKLVARWRPSAIKALYEPTVSLDIPEAGISGVFRVDSYSLDITTGAVTYALSLDEAAAYTWTTSEEGTPQLLPDPDVSLGIPDPTNFTAGPQGVQVSANTFSAGIAAVWDPPSSDALSPRLEYTSAGGSAWRAVPLNPAATTAAIGGLTDGAYYDLRLAFVASDGTSGGFVTETNIQALASTSAPAAPTSLNVTDQTGGVAHVTFTASASANIWKTQIYRDAVLIATFFNDPSEAVAFDDASGAGTFDWTARSINVSGVANAADAGPVTQTIT
ncbi:hypothetical protein QKW60_05540 [Defluviimonas aestuarii]|uniref:hypothetical protein n=1 Tax=Albidovulum aestuarii TaxID=1130726 RepID=UPI00249C43CF|nr:hypothetical protein [Defluviimonas aestuarii]MDI3335859.1 hypothetical protein [Defluviimonas aestuarii]